MSLGSRAGVSGCFMTSRHSAGDWFLSCIHLIAVASSCLMMLKLWDTLQFVGMSEFFKVFFQLHYSNVTGPLYQCSMTLLC